MDKTIKINIDASEAVAAVNELHDAIERVNTALNNLTISVSDEPATKDVSMAEMVEKVRNATVTASLIADRAIATSSLNADRLIIGGTFRKVR